VDKLAIRHPQGKTLIPNADQCVYSYIDFISFKKERGHLFGLFKKKSPLIQWEKKREALATKAFHAQRNGDIRLYSSLTADAEALGEKIGALKETDQT